MQNYAIGLSGLSAAQTALDIVGNNIANATTDGYHRQRVELAPSSTGHIGNVATGAGVDVAGVTRAIDGLLEGEILRQQSTSGQVSQELSVLSSIETSLGEFGDTGGLNASIDAFFTALQNLSAHPLEQVYRTEVISSAEALANEFRQLGGLLADIEDQLVLESQNTIDSINGLTAEIAALNGKIQSIEVGGEQANNLRDARDRLISQVSELAGVETQEREYGVVDVTIAGLPVVTGAVSTDLEVGQRSDQTLGVSVAGTEDYGSDIQGGRLGALLSLKNEQIVELRTRLDTLAGAIIDQVNQCHVQGLGLEGSFNELTGWSMGETDLSGGEASITDGTFYLRLTNTATGQVERYAVDVTVSGTSPDTLASVAAKIDSITGLSAAVVSSRLHIAADAGYSFDFLPALLAQPMTTTFTAALPPDVSVSGAFDGEQNQTFTFQVTGSGSVGNGTLSLTVTDGDGNVVASLNIGVGYAAGDVIELNNGIKIAVSTGQVNDGDSFQVEAFATTDTSGFLAAAGMNTFFSGSSASEMRLCSDIADSPERIATALGSNLTDNRGVLRLAAIRDGSVASLDDMTPNEYYQRLVADLGQDISLKQARQDNVEAMIQNLEKRRDDISSVNVNDEAAQLMIFEKMFQAMAKYLSSVQTTMTTLMDMV
jgi:flagellar hook-associated protein 1 FlgK